MIIENTVNYQLEPAITQASIEEAVSLLDIGNGGVLSDYVKIENFLLTIIGSRAASEFYAESLAQLEEAHSLSSRIGFGMRVRHLLYLNKPDVQAVRVFILRDVQAYTTLDNIFQILPTLDIAGKAFIETTDSGYYRRLGGIYEYPKPCIENYIELNKTVKDPSLMVQEYVRYYDELGKPINPDSFFVRDFCPCKPDDTEAAALGTRYEQGLREKVGNRIAESYAKIKAEHVDYYRNFDFLAWKEENRRAAGLF